MSLKPLMMPRVEEEAVVEEVVVEEEVVEVVEVVLEEIIQEEIEVVAEEEGDTDQETTALSQALEELKKVVLKVMPEPDLLPLVVEVEEAEEVAEVAEEEAEEVVETLEELTIQAALHLLLPFLFPIFHSPLMMLVCWTSSRLTMQRKHTL
jgi:hypothetical protein